MVVGFITITKVVVRIVNVIMVFGIIDFVIIFAILFQVFILLSNYQYFMQIVMRRSYLLFILVVVTLLIKIVNIHPNNLKCLLFMIIIDYLVNFSFNHFINFVNYLKAYLLYFNA